MVAGIGSHSGLRVVLYTNSTEFYCSTKSSYGFLLQLHAPHENALLPIHPVPIAYETRLAFDPVVLKSEPNIKRIQIEHRKCLFEDESQLEVYRYVKFHDLSISIYQNTSVLFRFLFSFTLLSIYSRQVRSMNNFPGMRCSRVNRFKS